MKLLISLVPLILIQSCCGAYRLNNTGLTVESYVLKISSINDDQFNGQVIITVKMEKDADTIELHAENMKFSGDFKIDNASAQILGPDKDTQIITLKQDGPIKAGTRILQVLYTGQIITDEMYGFYKSTYGDNNEKILYATQFEPIYARRLLPCFDEPAYKATFEVTVDHSNTFSVLSNTKALSIEPKNNQTTTTKFAKTPRMSTYLLALVVSEFKTSASKLATTAVWTSKEKVKYTTIAEDVTPKLIEQLGKFVNLTYPTLGINKSDQVAIPDFAAGAMENWGLITYRESDLLDEAEKTTASGKQKVATVICHELAHQWFGDYVTMNWWGETWLNEGFATYFEYHVADLLQDDFDLDKQFVVKVVQSVLLSDSVSTVQALYTPEEQVASLVQINYKFSDISYDKGGSVLRMVQHVLGLATFKKALNTYLTGHQTGSVAHNDLIKAIGADGEKFRHWFEQPGYPLVTVSLDNTRLTLTQKHYTTIDTNQTWSIPINYQTSDAVTSSVIWIEKAEGNVIDLKTKVDWIVVNNLQAGFYRVNYDEALWKAVTDALETNNTQINELNRAQLIDDAFNLANTGDVTYNTAFSLIKYLKNEDSYYPWYSTFSVITGLLKKVESDNLSAAIKKEMLTLMADVVVIPENATSKIEGTHIETLKTVDILSKACTFGHDGCVTFARSVLTAYLKDKNINNDFRAFGLCTAISKSTDKKEWDGLWELLLKSETSHEKDDILAALACTQDETILATYLQKTIDSNSGIRRQDGKSVMRAIIRNGPNGIKAALDFMKTSDQTLLDYYKGMNILGDLILSLGNALSNTAQIKTLTDYIDAHQNIEEVKAVSDQVKELMSNSEKWWKTNKDVLLQIFPEADIAGANSITITFGLLCLSILFIFNV